VTARHEQGCAFMADGYARVSGQPGVAFVITGPGLTNALTAMAQSRGDSVPVLVISGVNRRGSLGRGLGLLHELPDQAAMLRALCPTRQITEAAEVGPVLDWAWDLLTQGRPGPVHVEVPTDVMPLPCDALPAPAMARPRPVPALDGAAALLNKAHRVVILSGGGCRGQEAALAALADRLDAPVVQTANARGMLHRHPLCVAASPSIKAVRQMIRDADQVLSIGTEFGPTEYDMFVDGGFPDLPRQIRIDIDAAQLARRPAALTLQGDAGDTMRALLPLLTQHAAEGHARARSATEAARAELPEFSLAYPAMLAMVEAVRTALPRAILVGDSTQPVYAANLTYNHDRPGGFFNATTGYGALGFAPGAAVGAALAAPGTKVICLIGDGGLQFSPGELRTAVDERLPITFLVWNNAAYAEIAAAMHNAGTEIIGCHPSPLRLEPFAAACDLPFTSIPQDPELLHWALTQPVDGPRLIEVRVTL
jgi:acetolactate synthase-1/2/3 large subunit